MEKSDITKFATSKARLRMLEHRLNSNCLALSSLRPLHDGISKPRRIEHGGLIGVANSYIGNASAMHNVLKSSVSEMEKALNVNDKEFAVYHAFFETQFAVAAEWIKKTETAVEEVIVSSELFATELKQFTDIYNKNEDVTETLKVLEAKQKEMAKFMGEQCVTDASPLIKAQYIPVIEEHIANHKKTLDKAADVAKAFLRQIKCMTDSETGQFQMDYHFRKGQQYANDMKTHSLVSDDICEKMKRVISTVRKVHQETVMETAAQFLRVDVHKRNIDDVANKDTSDDKDGKHKKKK